MAKKIIVIKNMMMEKTDIYHIYWGTAGNAGLYLDEIYQVLNEAGYKQKAFVSYYYPFLYGRKIFYRFSELGHTKLKRSRMLVRYIEMIWAFIIIFFETLYDKPRIINYSMVGIFAPIRWYLIFSQKVIGCKIVITCHDVVGSESGDYKVSNIAPRQKLFDMADYLLVHTINSKRELVEQFKEDEKKIYNHLFPIMNLNKMNNNDNHNFKSKCDFLFIGHIRKEKGVDILLNAWDLFHVDYPAATLRVAGNIPKSEEYLLEKYGGRTDVVFILKFLSDADYCGLIKSTRFVVMPYTRGTNSGVVSTVLSIGAEVIASNIPMFKENPLIDKDLLFESENAQSLYSKMALAIQSEEKRGQLELKINRYRAQFANEVVEVYSEFINKH